MISGATVQIESSDCKTMRESIVEDCRLDRLSYGDQVWILYETCGLASRQATPVVFFLALRISELRAHHSFFLPIPCIP